MQSLFKEALQHHQAGRLDEATRMYRQILSLDSKHADTLHLLGMAAFQRGQHKDAADLIQKAIKLNKGEALYYSNLGTVLHSTGRLDKAIAAYERAVHLKPDYSDAHNNLGNSLLALGRVVEAMREFERVLALNPCHADAHTNLGVGLAEQGRIAEAVPHYHEALRLKPDCAETWSNLGNALQAQTFFAQAIECYLRALKLKPDYLAAYYNLGNTLQALDKFEDAFGCYERALSIQPGYAQARYGKALGQLVSGNFVQGWQNYEARWSTADQTPRRESLEPLWTGQKLTSGRLLLWGEQGVGDEIMFAGLIPEAAVAAGNRCVVECDARLKPLFARSFPEIEVISGINPAKRKDLGIEAHLPTGSLPALYRSSEGEFSRTKSPYLAADPERKQKFHIRYQAAGLTVGVAWHTKNVKTGPSRCIPLDAITALTKQAGVHWVSLQYGDYAVLKQQIEAAGAPIVIEREVDQLADLDGFAAQIAALDLVITIDNSTAHLAGALGVPVWVLLPKACDWRWLRMRDDSPWYPSMRLFRQATHGDWLPVFQAVSGELNKIMESVLG